MAVKDGAHGVKLPRESCGTIEAKEQEAHRQAQERPAESQAGREGGRAEKDETPVNGGPVEKLVRIGFSEIEARAYVALLQASPMTSDMLAQVSGIPNSLANGIAEQLVEHGAAITLATDPTLRYAPIPVDELLDRLQQEHADLIASVRKDLRSYGSRLDPVAVWNIEGEANILARAGTMIRRASRRIYLGALPATLEAMRPALELALERGVQVVVYTTSQIDLTGARVIVTPCPDARLEQMSAVGLILIRDGQEALIGEWLSPQRAQASWTQGPTLVSIAEQHLVRGGRRRFSVFQEADRREERNDSSPSARRSRGVGENRSV